MKKNALYWAEWAERGIYWAVGTLLITFRQDMVEVGLLSLTVLILAVAIYLVRKSKSFLPSDQES